MKRAYLILALLAVCFAGWVFFSSSYTNPKAPRYVVFTNQPAGSFGKVLYSWGGAPAFEGDKVWIFSIVSRGSYHHYLFDFDRRKILGELLNGGPTLWNANQSKLLCQGLDSYGTSVKGRLVTWLAKASGGRIHIPTNRIESFWLLDLRNNSARQLGSLGQWPGTGSNWKASPDFNRGYNVPNNDEEDSSFFLCDLDEGTFDKIQFKGSLRGWWDDHHILIITPPGDLVLYDVRTRTAKTMIGIQTIAARLQEIHISDDPRTVTTFSVWNKTNYDFFLVSSQYWSATNGSFMFKLNHTGEPLQLFWDNFKFKWLGRFNADETKYVYPGESGIAGRGGNGAVFLLDLTTSNVTTLIPPNTNNQYTLPQFYGDSVIYSRDGQMWSVNLDGSRNARVLPPPDGVSQAD